MRDILSTVRFAFLLGWRTSRRAALLSMLEVALSLLSALLPLLFALLVTGVMGGNLTMAVAGGLGAAVVMGGQLLATFYGMTYRVGLMMALAADVEGRTARYLAQLPTLSHNEDPELQEKVQTLRDQMGGVGSAYNQVVNSLRWVIAPVLTLIVAIGADWRLALVALAGLPQLLVNRRIMQITDQGDKDGAEGSRRSRSLLALTADRSGAGELRTFGARAFLQDRLRRAHREWGRPQESAAWMRARLTLLASLPFMLVAAGVIAWLGYDATQGTVSVAVIVIALTSLENLQGSLGEFSMGMRQLTRSSHQVQRFLWLEKHLAEELAAHSGDAAPPERLHEGIRLEHVTFTRPGADEPVIRDLSLDLPAGTIVALVGENGAGKSTLVDLLLGMHDLDSGRILVDGQDLCDLDLEKWRERCAGAFQDHARLEVTAQEAIGVGDLPRVTDARAAHQALEDAAATDVLTALPHGLSTQLGSSWPGGVGLSGGQWQRLAIARGMMRPHPLLRVLDEPTSALDPATEDALFTGYAAAAHGTAAHGGVTLLVTHRFSTVAAADLVVVLDRGRVIEQGTHAELMARGGHYHELYSLQSRGYA